MCPLPTAVLMGEITYSFGTEVAWAQHCTDTAGRLLHSNQTEGEAVHHAVTWTSRNLCSAPGLVTNLLYAKNPSCVQFQYVSSTSVSSPVGKGGKEGGLRLPPEDLVLRASSGHKQRE